MMVPNKAPYNVPGKVFLKTGGILMILFGLACIGSGAGGSVGVALSYETLGLLFVLLAGLAVAGIVFLVSGIVGLVNCSKLERATTCHVFGIIAGGASVIGMLLITLLMGSDVNAVLDAYGGLYILPPLSTTLYIIGAIKNRKAKPTLMSKGIKRR